VEPHDSAPSDETLTVLTVTGPLAAWVYHVFLLHAFKEGEEEAPPPPPKPTPAKVSPVATPTTKVSPVATPTTVLTEAPAKTVTPPPDPEPSTEEEEDEGEKIMAELQVSKTHTPDVE